MSAISKKAVIVCCVVSICLMFVSVNIKVLGLDISQIFKIWCAASFFVLALRASEKRICPVIENMGNRYSLYVYLSHYIIGIIIKDFLAAFKAPQYVGDYILPVLVIAASIFLSMLLYRLQRYRLVVHL